MTVLTASQDWLNSMASAVGLGAPFPPGPGATPDPSLPNSAAPASASASTSHIGQLIVVGVVIYVLVKGA